MIIPTKETAEDVRPRPPTLRQQPKRRFSMYVSSPNDTQPSTSNAQPPISLRFKRISVPSAISDLQKMPPPPVKPIPAKPTENVDLTTFDLKYVCNYCDFQADSFEMAHTHWLKVHKKGDDGPITKRFCYRVTCQVKCIYCTENVSFHTIRSHMLHSHVNCAYVFAKYNKSPSNSLQCGICSKYVSDNEQLIAHFAVEHQQSQQIEWKFEPLPMINDTILEKLIQQGDQGTFKCLYCKQYFPCRHDFEQHHKEEHPMKEQMYEQNGKDIIKYGCFVCPTTRTDEKVALEHLRIHFPPLFQCLHCLKKARTLKQIQYHHQLSHEELDISFKMISGRELLNAFHQLKLTFSNGLTLMRGDLANTKYGDINRLIKYNNDFNIAQTQQHLNLLKGSNSTASTSNAFGKIGQRRQTLL